MNHSTIKNIHDPAFDLLVEKELGWTKIIRPECFQRGWCVPGESFTVNNIAAVRALEEKGINLERFGLGN